MATSGYQSGAGDQEASPCAYVVLATTVPLRAFPVTPRRIFLWLLGLAIRACSFSRVAHCAVGDGACVLNSTFERVARRPFDAYILRYPGLLGFYRIPLKGPLDLRVPPAARKRPPRVVLQWLTAGLVPDPASCVSLAAARLRAAGVPLPRHATPAGLARWLRRRGYHYESLE